MLTPDQISQYQQSSITRAGCCANCGEVLHPLEVYACEHCAMELLADPNSTMHEEEDDGRAQAAKA
jgi:predicted amidophosphoribosyltransferase